MVSFYLAGLMTLGGGGSPAPLAELTCELLAALALLAWLALAPPANRAVLPRAVLAIAGLAIAVPALQLIPLPHSAWQALPGRDNLRAALDLTGSSGEWWPVSIAPHRTLAAVLALGPPLVMMLFAACARGRETAWLIAATVAISLLAIGVGAGQLAQAGGGWLDFYQTGDTGTLHGFSANRNTAADIHLIGLAGLAAMWRLFPATRTRTGTAALVAAAGLQLLAIFLTGSRTGIAMIPIAIAFAFAIVRTRSGEGHSAPRWKLPAALAVASLTAVLGIWWWSATPAIARVLARFDFSGEFRPELWRDSVFAARLYWPIGSGLGTFHPAMLPAERLEVVDMTLPNRAHNELLELAIEGGLPLLVCWLAIAAIVIWRLRAALIADGASSRPIALFAAAILAIATLHSLVDYPLRSMAMAGLVAMAAGIVLSARERS